MGPPHYAPPTKKARRLYPSFLLTATLAVVFDLVVLARGWTGTGSDLTRLACHVLILAACFAVKHIYGRRQPVGLQIKTLSYPQQQSKVQTPLHDSLSFDIWTLLPLDRVNHASHVEASKHLWDAYFATMHDYTALVHKFNIMSGTQHPVSNDNVLILMTGIGQQLHEVRDKLFVDFMKVESGMKVKLVFEKQLERELEAADEAVKRRFVPGVNEEEQEESITDVVAADGVV